MKLPINELKKYLQTIATAELIAEKLTQIGFEVEEIQDFAIKYKNFVIGKVLSIEKHPNADKLNVCQVNIGNQTRQIVCGASNVRGDLTVVVSLEGAVIPNSGMIIKKTVIRGIESNGMICSESELGLSNESEGILELEGDYKIGESFAGEFFNNDVVLTLNVTPNRGDCNGVIGLARELCTAEIGSLNFFEPSLDFDDKALVVNNKVADSFGMIALNGVTNIKSTEIIKNALHKFGITSHNLIVDVSNLTMMTFGLPIHIYNADAIKGGITVDMLGEIQQEFTDLKDNKHAIKSCIIVKDSEKILSILGVMGGKSSSVDMNTQNIIIECAYINPISFARSVKNLAIKTDARYRFERGIDRNKIEQAIAFAANLIKQYCGGKVVAGFKQDLIKHEFKIINYSFENYYKLMGTKLIDKKLFDKIITNLGFFYVPPQTRQSFLNDNLCTTVDLIVPTHRHDISIEADITEEVARIIGYDRIECKYAIPFQQIADNSKYFDLLKIKKMICSLGLTEVINFAFIDKKDAVKFGYEINKKLEIINPISSNLNYMRPSLIIGLLNNLSANISKNKMKNISIFEEGVVFDSGECQQFAGVMLGNKIIDDHFKESREYDIFDASIIINKILVNIYNIERTAIKECKEFFAHPYRCFEVFNDNILIAKYGEIHPKIASAFDISERIIFFEFFIDKVIPNNKKNIEQNDLHPIVKDMAFIVENDCLCNDMINSIYDCSELIENIIICDVYSSTGIKNGYKSIMFRLNILPKNELSGDEINLLMLAIANKLKHHYNAELRGEL